jgi:Dna[CI] antecedent, DciA
VALNQAVGAGFAARIFTRGSPPALALLKAAWPAAVGPELARRTEVLALERDFLRVRIPDARWRKVLHRMQPQILEHLRRVAGDLVPRRLGFTEGPPCQPEPGPEPSDRMRSSELPTPPAWGGDRGGGSMKEAPPAELPDGVAAAARRIDDPEIRALFESSAARYLAAFGARHA